MVIGPDLFDKIATGSTFTHEVARRKLAAWRVLLWLSEDQSRVQALADAYSGRAALLRLHAARVDRANRRQRRVYYRRANECDELALKISRKVRHGERTNVSWRVPQAVQLARLLNIDEAPIWAHFDAVDAKLVRRAALSKLAKAFALSVGAGVAVAKELAEAHPSLTDEIAARAQEHAEHRLLRPERGLGRRGRLPAPRGETPDEAYAEAVGIETPYAADVRDVLAGLSQPVGVIASQHVIGGSDQTGDQARDQAGDQVG